MIQEMKEREKLLLALNPTNPSKRKEILQKSGVNPISFSVLMKYLCNDGLAVKLKHNEYQMTNSGELYAQQIRAKYGSNQSLQRSSTNSIETQNTNDVVKELVALKKKFGKTALFDAFESLKEWEE